VGTYLSHGPKMYPMAYENPRAFSCISGPIYFKSSIQCPCGVGFHQYVLGLVRKIEKKEMRRKERKRMENKMIL